MPGGEVIIKMETLQIILLIIQVLVALSLIGFILIQHGKGADAGAAFGSGASNTVFGAQGSGNFMTRTTTVLAFVFLANSLALAWIAKERVKGARELNLNIDTGVVEQQLEKMPAVIDEVPVDNGDLGIPVIPE